MLDELNFTDKVSTAVDTVARDLANSALAEAALGELSWFIPVAGVVDPVFFVVGENRSVATGQSGDYLTQFAGTRQHVMITANNTDTGTLRVTGTSDTSENGVPLPADTEDIALDGTNGQLYQSLKKWLEIDSITVVSGTLTNYDISLLGYFDAGNQLFSVTGYRADVKTTTNAADLRVRFTKVKNDGGQKISLPDFEDYGFDSTAVGGEYVDDIRTGVDDRSFTMSVNLAPANAQIALKIFDFDTFFTSDENVLDGTNNEGLIISFEGVPLVGISNVDTVTLTVGLNTSP